MTREEFLFSCKLFLKLEVGQDTVYLVKGGAVIMRDTYANLR